MKHAAKGAEARPGSAPVSGQLSLRQKGGSHGEAFLRSRVFARCCYLKGIRTTAAFLPKTQQDPANVAEPGLASAPLAACFTAAGYWPARPAFWGLPTRKNVLRACSKQYIRISYNRIPYNRIPYKICDVSKNTTPPRPKKIE